MSEQHICYMHRLMDGSCRLCGHTSSTGDDGKENTMTSEELILDDAKRIRDTIDGSIQRWGAGNLAKALVSIEAQDDIFTLADYMTPGELTLIPAQEVVCKEAWAIAQLGLAKQK